MKKNFQGFQNILAIIIIVFSFSFFMWIIHIYSSQKLPESNIISQILSTVVVLASLVCSYYFGSSKTSAAKDDTINKMQSQQNTPTTINTDVMNNKVDTIKTDNIETVSTNEIKPE